MAIARSTTSARIPQGRAAGFAAFATVLDVFDEPVTMLS